MSELVRWGDIAFHVSPTSMRGIKDIAIEAGCETEDSTVDGEKFVKRKNGNPYAISMTALLDARLGEDVQSVATQMTEAARLSRTGYFYTGGAKLFPSQFMMVTAKINNIELMPGGKWLRCEVALTLKQASKYDGTTSSAATQTSGGSGESGGGSGNGTGSKKVSTKTQSAAASNINLGYGPVTNSYAEKLAAADAAAKEAAKPKVTDSLASQTTQNYAAKAGAGLQAMANAVVNQAKTQSQSVVVKAQNAASQSTSSKVSTVSGVRKNTNNMMK